MLVWTILAVLNAIIIELSYPLQHMKVNQEHAVTNFPFILCLIPWRGDKAGNTFHTATCEQQVSSFSAWHTTYHSQVAQQPYCKWDAKEITLWRTGTVRSQEDTAWGRLTVPSWQTATNMSCGAQVDHSTASGILQVRVVALVSMVILPRLYMLITAASQSATFMDRKIAVNLNMVQCINDDLGYIWSECLLSDMPYILPEGKRHTWIPDTISVTQHKELVQKTPLMTSTVKFRAPKDGVHFHYWRPQPHCVLLSNACPVQCFWQWNIKPAWNMFAGTLPLFRRIEEPQMLPRNSPFVDCFKAQLLEPDARKSVIIYSHLYRSISEQHCEKAKPQ